MAQKPNIVIFNPDQWRGDVLAHMGHPAAVTPNLDRIAREEGVSFRNAYAPNVCCTASRCSFMTGWYPHVRGHRTMSHMLQPDEPMLLRTLKQNGYVVWWGGKNDVVPAQNGFDGYCHIKYEPPPEETAKKPIRPANPNWRGEPNGHNFFSFLTGRLEGDPLSGEWTSHDWAMVRGAIDFIANHDGENPFCIYLPLFFPHPPYAAEEPWFSMIDRSVVPRRAPVPKNKSLEPSLYEEMRSTLGMQNWTDEQWAELQATYYAACARVDHQYGMLLEALKSAGIYDDTAVFFFSDHGDFTGDYDVVQKDSTVFPDCLMRVPLVIKPPADVKCRTGISDALVELIDFPATVEDLTGIPPEHSHFGRSLLPVLSGKTDTHRDTVFSEGGRRYGETSCMGLELIDEPVEDNLYWPTLRLHRTERPSNGKAVMLRTHEYKYVKRLFETDELYDLRKDPQETVNHIHDPDYADVLAQLRDRMMTFLLETNDVVPLAVDAREANADAIARVNRFNQAHGKPA